MVALGWAQPLLDFVFWMHLIQPVLVIRPFSLPAAAALIVFTSIGRVRHRVSLRRAMEQTAPLSGARVEPCSSPARLPGESHSTTKFGRNSSANSSSDELPIEQGNPWSRTHVRRSRSARNTQLHLCRAFSDHSGSGLDCLRNAVHFDGSRGAIADMGPSVLPNALQADPAELALMWVKLETWRRRTPFGGNTLDSLRGRTAYSCGQTVVLQ